MIGQTQQEEFESENLEPNEIGMSTSTGASTSAVSRMFGDGAFSDNRKRYIILGGAVGGVLLVFAAVYFFLGSGDDAAIPPVQEGGIASEQGNIPGGMPEGLPPPDGQMPTGDPSMAGDPALGGGMPGAGMEGVLPPGVVQIVTPADGQSRVYDETMGEAMFNWEGEADYIVFSRDSSLTNGLLRLTVSGQNSFNFHSPHPGKWYWRLESVDQAPLTEIHSFYVAPPQRRNISLSEPGADASISGDSMVSWTTDEKVSYYRVEVSSGSFSNPNYRFSTVGSSLQLNGVMPGSYQLRVGAFSEVSGRWEYTDPISVSVQ